MKSMTGFGRSECEASYGKIIAEVQSVNRKYLEINISLPKEFNQFENDLRKLVTEKVQRGFVSVRIHIVPSAPAIRDLLPDLSLLEELKRGWEHLAAKLSLAKETIDLPFLVEQLSLISSPKRAKEEDFAPICECIGQALVSLDEMKRIEGATLAKDMKERLKGVSHGIDAIEKQSPESSNKLRLKLQERLKELFQTEVDDRVLREVALFAEQVDISEEITRFRSHIMQYEGLLKETGTFGRKIDFLLQEMGREINTMASKARDAKIAHQVIHIKAELEKMREQIQNIE